MQYQKIASASAKRKVWYCVRGLMIGQGASLGSRGWHVEKGLASCTALGLLSPQTGSPFHELPSLATHSRLIGDFSLAFMLSSKVLI